MPVYQAVDKAPDGGFLGRFRWKNLNSADRIAQIQQAIALVFQAVPSAQKR